MRKSRTRSQNSYRTNKKQTSSDHKKQRIEVILNFEFINKNYAQQLNCLVCRKLMKEPTRLYDCGHTFCNDCIPLNKCPECLMKNIVKHKNLIAIGMINQLKVRCLNNGCPFTGAYQQYISHHSKNCKVKDGMDNWMQRMRGLMADFSQIKVKTASAHRQSQQSKTKQNNQDQDQHYNSISFQIKKQYKEQKEQSNSNGMKEQQAYSNRMKNLMQFIQEEQLLGGKILMDKL